MKPAELRRAAAAFGKTKGRPNRHIKALHVTADVNTTHTYVCWYHPTKGHRKQRVRNADAYRLMSVLNPPVPSKGEALA